MTRTDDQHLARVRSAIRRSWSRETSAVPDEWDPANAARGHCDVSAFVAWEHLGGDLVLGAVFVDGVQTEHHYWNRVAGSDIDLTGEQFAGTEEVRELEVLTSSEIDAQRHTMKADVAARIARFRSLVEAELR